ncbi:MAG: SGNH/GDSL hydrolase family protein [Lachnospiraceae bacterium]|nr:SGNH/GDSL hydrolase family protein [Lachnospiraceae bacterium]
MHDLDLNAGMINKGNTVRIKNVMKKAAAGKDITVAFLGGSITQGCHSSTPDKCYAALIHKWWSEKFPGCDVSFINAGIGATTSFFGVSRVGEHLLSKNPDFILTEFAVNDADTDFFKETYEGLVRKIIYDRSRPALLLMNNIKFDDNTSAEEIHLEVAKHYDIPMVSMKSTIMAAIQKGSFGIDDISPDGLHPNDEGHRMVSDVVTAYLDKIYDSIGLSASEESDPYADKDRIAPITENAYEDSFRIKNYNMTGPDHSVKLEGFEPDLHKKEDFLDIFSSGFTASKKGDSITFRVYGSGLAAQYKKTVELPAPVAKAVIDGDEENAVILDANFDETWGDCLYLQVLGRHMELKEHEVKITLIETHEDDKVPFYLTSLIVSR